MFFHVEIAANASIEATHERDWYAAKVAEMTAQAAAVDAAEDAQFGPDRHGDEPPDSMSGHGRAGRAARLRRCLQEITATEADLAETAQSDRRAAQDYLADVRAGRARQGRAPRGVDPVVPRRDRSRTGTRATWAATLADPPRPRASCRRPRPSRRTATTAREETLPPRNRLPRQCLPAATSAPQQHRPRLTAHVHQARVHPGLQRPTRRQRRPLHHRRRPRPRHQRRRTTPTHDDRRRPSRRPHPPPPARPGPRHRRRPGRQRLLQHREPHHTRPGPAHRHRETPPPKRRHRSDQRTTTRNRHPTPSHGPPPTHPRRRRPLQETRRHHRTHQRQPQRPRPTPPIPPPAARPTPAPNSTSPHSTTTSATSTTSPNPHNPNKHAGRRPAATLSHTPPDPTTQTQNATGSCTCENTSAS